MLFGARRGRMIGMITVGAPRTSPGRGAIGMNTGDTRACRAVIMPVAVAAGGSSACPAVVVPLGGAAALTGWAVTPVATVTSAVCMGRSSIRRRPRCARQRPSAPPGSGLRRLRAAAFGASGQRPSAPPGSGLRRLRAAAFCGSGQPQLPWAARRPWSARESSPQQPRQPRQPRRRLPRARSARRRVDRHRPAGAAARRPRRLARSPDPCGRARRRLRSAATLDAWPTSTMRPRRPCCRRPSRR